jgi:YVTN family beta-propeller protein
MRLFNWHSLFLFSLLIFSGLALHAQPKSSSSSGYHVIKQVKLGGDGGWDALTFDAKAHRLYISRSTHVMVVDVDSGALVRDIPNTPGVHGIAIVSDLNKGFTSNGRDSTVTVFDLKTLKALKQIPVGKNPDAIIYDAASKRVFTFNGASNDATAIDPRSETVVGTISLDAKPEFAEADENGHIFVNLEDKSAIAELDSRKLSVLARWPLAPGEEPSGIALDRRHKRLFAACANQMMVVMNADNGKVITTVPIGSGVDGAGFDAGTEMAFSSNGGDGTLTVVHEDSAEKFSVVENVTTQRGARTMTVDPKSHRVFLETAEFGQTPAPTPERPRPRPSIVPGSFTLLIFGR